MKTVWPALAKEVLVDGVCAEPYKTWSQIDANLPAEAIEVLGPPPTSGTRDAFLELVMDKGLRYVRRDQVIADDKVRKAACEAIQKTAPMSMPVKTTISSSRSSRAIRPPSAFSVTASSSRTATGSRPRRWTGSRPASSIVAGQYEVARSLYFYVKPQQIDVVPGIKQYVAEFMSDRARGLAGIWKKRE